MIPVISLLVTLGLSLLVTRIGSVALTLTGMAREVARFQARSAYSGCGYTTREAEQSLAHPVRRQIVMTLMLLGNLGVAAVAGTVVVSLTANLQGQNLLPAICLLFGGLLVLGIVAQSKWIEDQLNVVIQWSLKKWTKVDTRDYVSLLQLTTDYAVTELSVSPNDWLAKKTLIELRLPAEGVLVLGIRRREGDYLGAPHATTEIRAFDTVVLYGPIGRIKELDERRSGRRGDKAHQSAKAEHHEKQLQTDDAEPAAKTKVVSESL
ncbi:TrkA C-terminal domain-containing protein [Planctomycetes bacterium K23_9]|uniref:TrkA-C domain protein n=1 Tax=Stieleria marina TaxID=1930275 RepID=A0A517NPF3_9BACT|nr:TrkA-C domain protein [Planctomycetes bacterium K23_9]